jgi:hypothetical protein
MWTTGSDKQLLFIFPARVSLTAITLHYYSDGVQGRPRLRFYAVPDDFNIWDTLASGNPYLGIPAVPPGEEQALPGYRNVRVNANFNTMKVLMYKYRSSQSVLAVSEVEFFTMACRHRIDI